MKFWISDFSCRVRFDDSGPLSHGKLSAPTPITLPTAASFLRSGWV